jgi:GT2 family glycosyltransferase
LEQVNEGICKTLNKGLRQASGKYVALLASDDIWALEKIGKQVHLMERNENVGLVFSDHYFVHVRENTKMKATDYKPNTRKYFKRNIQNINLYEKLMTENFIPALTVLMRKDCIDKVGGFDEELSAEDYDMWLRMAKEYPIAFIDEPLAYYRFHEMNLSNSINLKVIRLILKILSKQYREKPLKNHYLKIGFLFVNFWFTLIWNRMKRIFSIERSTPRLF